MEQVDTGWRKSSHSANGANCVEVAAWRKSSHSGTGVNCVEADQSPAAILIRDTKDHSAGPVLSVTPAQWRRFTRSLKG